MARIQLRAICPICFNEQATKNGRMVDHGYTIPHEWHQRNGSCAGVNAMNFGTLEGRTVTEAAVADLLEWKAAQQKNLKDLPKLTKITGRNTDRSTFVNGKRVPPPDVELTEADGEWFTRAVAARKQRLEHAIRAATDQVAFWKGQVAAWVEKAPREVEVDTSVTLHAEFVSYSGKLFKGKTFCAPGNSMSGRYVYRAIAGATQAVTCTRCIKAMAQRDAALAQKATQ